jgi:hypothetical protein
MTRMRSARALLPASTIIAVVAFLLLALAFVLGYLPGDARGATRREWTMQTGGIALVLALLSMIPLGWFRWVLVVTAGAFLALSLTFWLTVGR